MDLSEIIAAAPDGTPESPTIIDLAGQTFATEETVRITARHGLTLRNFTIDATTDGATAQPWKSSGWPRNRSHLRIDGGSTGITFENVEVSGANPNAGTSSAAYVSALEAQHGFDIDVADGITLRNCRVFDVYGDFVYIRASNIVVEDCTFARNGRQGVAVSSGTNIRISRCVMDDMRRATFDLEPNLDSSMIDGVIIEDCSTGLGRLLWFACGGRGSGVKNVTIRRNVMRNNTGTPAIYVAPPVGHRRGPFTITDNVFRPQGSPQPVIHMQRVDGLTMTGNTLYASPTRSMAGIIATESTGLRLTRNTFVGTTVDISIA